jgi:CheY-like chemotaxis protein
MSTDKEKPEIRKILGCEETDCTGRESRRGSTVSAGESMYSGHRQFPFPVENCLPQVHNLLMPGVDSGREVTPLDYRRGNETILIVDDEESLRAVIGELLSPLGYNILSTSNGPDALALAENYPGKIDLLLTDVDMDPLSGPALAEALTRVRPEMKVVYISGYPAILAPDGTLKPGTVLVHKPFSMRILSAKLREVLESPDLSTRPIAG